MRRNEGPREPMSVAGAWPAAFLAVLALGAVAPLVTARSGRAGFVVLTCSVVGLLAMTSSAAAAAGVVVMGWLTVVGFGQRPLGLLRLSGTWPPHVALVLLAVGAGSWTVGHVARNAVTLDGMALYSDRWRGLGRAVSRRRRITGVAVAVCILPLITAALLAFGGHLALVDDVLLYLVTVVAITLIGGFWPAILAAVAASLLLNWFFTPPLHRWVVDAPQNMLALALFVTVAVIVSATVHVAARRAAVAAAATDEAEALLALARTVLAGADAPGDVLAHVATGAAVHAELEERVGDRWVTVARAGMRPDPDAREVVVLPRPDLRMRIGGAIDDLPPRLLDGYAAQAAAALDRERLRVQASQAEALAAGNRMRTALLAAVSHDLRTPLASVKASVSSLRATDVVLSEADRAELLATIEESADRLDALIGNLLDMSRLQTGSLEPFLRPTALDEIAPLALRGLEHGVRVELDIPDGLPLVATDPGLLDRVLANLLANALRYSPDGETPVLTARSDGDVVVIDVVDHGPGIPAADRQSAFEPFQRLGDNRSGGVGLGLAVAKGFTEAMGGSLDAADTPGGGLTMRVRLPVARAAAVTGTPT